MQTGNVAILVPIYKKELSELEKISLKQLKKVLVNYPIFVIIPYRLYDCYLQRNCCRIECFADEYFQSVDSYSNLLLEPMFYSRFKEYEYILIYQLDAFVFYDKLEYFCSMGYDYMGAPLSRWTINWHDLGARIGNGGLSLRRIDAMLRVLKMKNEILKHPLSNVFMKYEDLYFGYCGKIGLLNVPDISTALQFSIDSDIMHCYKKIHTILPFGCHGWFKGKYSIVKPLVENYGYDLPSREEYADPYQPRINNVFNYLCQRFLRKSSYRKATLLMRKIVEEKCVIWGYGEDGKRLINLLLNLNIRVEKIFDNHIKETKTNIGIPIQSICSYTDLYIYKGRFIIASGKYENEMKDYLRNNGFNDGDWLTLRNLKKAMIHGFIESR
ncbi:DUF5672 family protein [Selenomonas sp. FC4001]|uniref:DUF5672 family protein n=1 Tax=Selenomonas sp. FC4001 TaxID=1408313 RepID=UPI00068FFD11|nr:DUF5672 family protein [Selenomonas sp. FC4001]